MLTHSVGSLLVRAAALALALLTLAGCGSYTLQGRVVRGSYSGIMLVERDDPRLAEPGLGGVGVTVIRDFDKPNREQVAAANSAADGSISLPIKAFGAGITEEEWLFSAGRAQADRLDTALSLPANAKSVRLLIMMTRADVAPRAPGSGDAPSYTPTFDDEVERDLKKYSW